MSAKPTNGEAHSRLSRGRNNEQVRELAREAVRRTQRSNFLIDELGKKGERVMTMTRLDK